MVWFAPSTVGKEFSKEVEIVGADDGRLNYEGD